MMEPPDRTMAHVCSDVVNTTFYDINNQETARHKVERWTWPHGTLARLWINGLQIRGRLMGG